TTSATEPPPRLARSRARSSRVRRTCIASAVELADLVFVGGGLGRILEALLRAGEAAGAHVVGVGGDRFAGLAPVLAVTSHEQRRDARLDAEQVVVDEHLPVAVDAGADADRRNAQPRGDL